MEKLGSTAELQELSESEVVAMLQQHSQSGTEQTSFLAVVESLLEPRKNLVCGIMPAEEPLQPQPDDEPEQPEPDDKPEEAEAQSEK